MSAEPETRICVICGNPYKITYPGQQACAFACSRKLAGRTIKERGLVALKKANQTKRDTAKSAVEKLCLKRWPELSVREIEIFNFACALGYRRGYHKAYHVVARPKPALDNR